MYCSLSYNSAIYASASIVSPRGKGVQRRTSRRRLSLLYRSSSTPVHLLAHPHSLTNEGRSTGSSSTFQGKRGKNMRGVSSELQYIGRLCWISLMSDGAVFSAPEATSIHTHQTRPWCSSVRSIFRFRQPLQLLVLSDKTYEKLLVPGPLWSVAGSPALGGFTARGVIQITAFGIRQGRSTSNKIFSLPSAEERRCNSLRSRYFDCCGNSS